MYTHLRICPHALSKVLGSLSETCFLVGSIGVNLGHVLGSNNTQKQSENRVNRLRGLSYGIYPWRSPLFDLGHFLLTKQGYEDTKNDCFVRVFTKSSKRGSELQNWTLWDWVTFRRSELRSQIGSLLGRNRKNKSTEVGGEMYTHQILDPKKGTFLS